MPQGPSAQRRLGPSSFAYGCLLGEGAYGRVIHTKMVQADGTLGTSEYAMKIIEKRVITREKKVRLLFATPPALHASRNLTHLLPTFNNPLLRR